MHHALFGVLRLIPLPGFPTNTCSRRTTALSTRRGGGGVLSSIRYIGMCCLIGWGGVFEVLSP